MDQQTYQIIGTAIEVHKELGRGFLEPVYQEALKLEFSNRGIPFEPQREMSIFYKGRKLKTHYRSDFGVPRLRDGKILDLAPGLSSKPRSSAGSIRPNTPQSRNLRNLCNLRILNLGFGSAK
jgi:hypothetical protein